MWSGVFLDSIGDNYVLLTSRHIILAWPIWSYKSCDGVRVPSSISMRGPSITWMFIYCCRRANLLPLAVVKFTTPVPSPSVPCDGPLIPWFSTPLATDSSLFGTALETQYVSLTSMPAICALRFWVNQYTWRLYEMEQSWPTVPPTLAWEYGT